MSGGETRNADFGRAASGVEHRFRSHSAQVVDNALGPLAGPPRTVSAAVTGRCPVRRPAVGLVGYFARK
jgi:hypothetical protein